MQKRWAPKTSNGLDERGNVGQGISNDPGILRHDGLFPGIGNIREGKGGFVESINGQKTNVAEKEKGMFRCSGALQMLIALGP